MNLVGQLFKSDRDNGSAARLKERLFERDERLSRIFLVYQERKKNSFIFPSFAWILTNNRSNFTYHSTVL